MRKGNASQTALAAALLRAAHQVLDHDPLILEDPVSVGLVPGANAGEIKAQRDRLESNVMRTLRASFVVRSRIAEDQLRSEVSRGARSYVLLGAGFDTFGLRQPEWARSIQIFELDHSASQSAKIEHIRRLGLTVPSNLHFCPVDFEADTSSGVLEHGDIDPRHPTVFSFLGVVPYLSTSAVDDALLDLRSMGSDDTLILSFVVPESLLAGDDAVTASISATAAAARGEPWLSRYHPAEIEEKLRSAGWKSVRHISPVELENRFFQNRVDRLTVPSFERILVAAP